MAELITGHVVTLTDGRQATVRFVGTTHFAPGDWVGIELDEPTGKNDGAVQGERYFDCEPGFGMFIRPTAVDAIIEQPPARPPPKPAAPKAITTAQPTPARGRAQSGIAAGLKKPNAIATANTKRHSAGAASPTSALRGAAQRLSTKVMHACLRMGWPGELSS